MKISLVSIPVSDPVAAHKIYTDKLGFVSKQFDEENKLAIVAAAEDPDGTTLLLEPCTGSFYETFQKEAFEAKLPIMVFSVADAAAERKRLEEAGVTLRSDLDKPDWGLVNMFEDGCGNLLMFEQSS